jgi:hypothetical protein
MRAINNVGFKVSFIRDVTPIPHNAAGLPSAVASKTKEEESWLVTQKRNAGSAAAKGRSFSSKATAASPISAPMSAALMLPVLPASPQEVDRLRRAVA